MNQDLQGLLSCWDSNWRTVGCCDVVGTRCYAIKDTREKSIDYNEEVQAGEVGGKRDVA